MVHFTAFGALSVVGLALCSSVFVVFPMHSLATAYTVPGFGFFTATSVFTPFDSTNVWSLMYPCLGMGGLFRSDIV